MLRLCIFVRKVGCKVGACSKVVKTYILHIMRKVSFEQVPSLHQYVKPKFTYTCYKQ